MRHKALRWVVLTIVILVVGSVYQAFNNSGKYVDFSWSPNAQQIAFTIYGSNGIYVMHSDGSQTRKIDRSSRTKSYPSGSFAWSPNGQEILFSASLERDYLSGNTQIYSVKTDGSQNSQVIVHNSFAPQWSPNGKQIAFVSDDENNSCSLQVTDATDVQRAKKIFKNADYSSDCFYDLLWSPNSKQLLFSISRSTQYDIYIYTANSSTKPRHLLSGKSPVWSPDGERIAFFVEDEILVVDRAGKILSRPYNLPEAKPYRYGLQWSSDNRSLFVWTITCRDSDRLSFSYNICDLKIQKVEENQFGKAHQVLTFHAVGDAPSWSPDRKKIGFKSKGFLYVVNSDGSGLKKFK